MEIVFVCTPSNTFRVLMQQIPTVRGFVELWTEGGWPSAVLCVRSCPLQYRLAATGVYIYTSRPQTDEISEERTFESFAVHDGC
jgi:hypothetical protein